MLQQGFGNCARNINMIPHFNNVIITSPNPIPMLRFAAGALLPSPILLFPIQGLLYRPRIHAIPHKIITTNKKEKNGKKTSRNIKAPC
jgi:hypothetical protein